MADCVMWEDCVHGMLNSPFDHKAQVSFDTGTTLYSVGTTAHPTDPTNYTNNFSCNPLGAGVIKRVIDGRIQDVYTSSSPSSNDIWTCTAIPNSTKYLCTNPSVSSTQTNIYICTYDYVSDTWSSVTTVASGLTLDSYSLDHHLVSETELAIVASATFASTSAVLYKLFTSNAMLTGWATRSSVAGTTTYMNPGAYQICCNSSRFLFTRIVYNTNYTLTSFTHVTCTTINGTWAAVTPGIGAAIQAYAVGEIYRNLFLARTCTYFIVGHPTTGLTYYSADFVTFTAAPAWDGYLGLFNSVLGNNKYLNVAASSIRIIDFSSPAVYNISALTYVFPSRSDATYNDKYGASSYITSISHFGKFLICRVSSTIKNVRAKYRLVA